MIRLNQLWKVESFCPYLEIPVDDAELVEIVDGADDLGTVELGPLLRELPLLAEVKVQLATVDVLSYQAQPVHCCE